jgi:uncharacterized protein YjiK
MPKFLLLGLIFCFSTLNSNCVANDQPPFSYHLNDPDATFSMPSELKEISGLSLTGNAGMIAAVNDEKGIIYLLGKSDGQIKSRIEFRDEGDYEGIEIVGNDAWVCKSNGTLYHVENYEQPNPQVTSYKSFLSKENDVEGLAYDPVNNRLLIGCKGKGAVQPNAPLNKAIYAFDLQTKTVSEQPAFLLTEPALKEFLAKNGGSKASKLMEDIFQPQEEALKFSPSAIAIHPKTGDVYIASAKGNTLLVLSAAGEILHIEHLKKSVHAQPEGICFDTDGTLYIANEGLDGSPAKIYVFHKFL